MINAHQLSRACRQPGFRPHGPGGPPPPAFMTVPTTCARAAVREYHTNGQVPATAYLAGSKVGSWTSHTNKSMASGAQAVMDGFDWYVHSDAADGRTMKALDEKVLVMFPAGPLEARVDVVLDDGADLAGRVIMWDGPVLTAAAAPTIACAFAHALQSRYPGRTIATIGVWQARRQQSFEVPFAQAMAQLNAANSIFAAL